MLRIIDLERAIKELPFPMEVKEKIKIEVIDPNASWNSGIWELEIEDGKGNLEKSENWDISLNITTLCQIISGILSPQKAYKLKTIDVKNTESLEKLERIFPIYPTFCWDYF
ncbi:MAG: sterol carrier protein domain-containing protein [Dictyoglomaceae bacterium]